MPPHVAEARHRAYALPEVENPTLRYLVQESRYTADQGGYGVVTQTRPPGSRHGVVWLTLLSIFGTEPVHAAGMLI